MTKTRLKVALCGSARFEDSYHFWNERLSLEGNVVYSLAVYPSCKGGQKDWYNEDQKEMLDAVHLAKIEESDVAFIIDCDHRDPSRTYIGSSTLRELT